MAAVNPYQSPETAGPVPAARPQPVYRSRGHALRAGSWRGAKFGGTLMAVILGAIALAVWLWLAAMLVYRCLVNGVNPSSVLSADLLEGVGMTLGAIIVSSLWGALIGAAIMGVAAAAGYRKPGERGP